MSDVDFPQDRVRWFWYTFTLESASEPSKQGKIFANQLAADIPPKTSVLPFALEESRILESVFREHPTVHACHARHQPPDPSYRLWVAREDDPIESDTGCPKVTVRGGLYDASLGKRYMEAAYWPGSTHMLVRGTWFCNASAKAPKKEKWVPLREGLAAAVEQAWAERPWASGRAEVPVSVGSGSWTVYFLSETEVYIAGQEVKTMDKIKGLFRTKASPALPPNALALRRGLEPGSPTTHGLDLDMDEVASRSPVKHIVFAVHGVGQNLARTSMIWDATSAIRKRMFALAPKLVPEEAQRGGRVEVIPINWRSQISLPSDDLMTHVSPMGNANLRSLMANTLLEVMSYQSLVQAQEMVQSLGDALNRAHERFTARNPQFSGKVSVMGHSLGSIITYDILCNQPHLYSRLGVDIHEPLHPGIIFPDLNFPVENLFLVGSPVTVFLSLRGYNPASQKHNPTALGQPMSAHRAPHIYGGCGDGLPAVKRLWNIFHRYDPVAYRIEPMIDIAMSGAPVPLMPKGALSKYAEVMGTLSEKLSSLNPFRVKGVDQAVEVVETLDGYQEPMRTPFSDLDESEPEPSGVPPAGPTARAVCTSNPGWCVAGGVPDEGTIAKAEPEIAKGRIDFMLPPDSSSSMIQAVRSVRAHTGYWESSSVALFLSRVCHGLDPLSGGA